MRRLLLVLSGVLAVLGVAAGVWLVVGDGPDGSDGGPDRAGGGAPEVDVVSTRVEDLLGRDWVVERFEVDDEVWDVPDGLQLPMSFGSGWITGSSCNGVGGTTTIGPGTFTAPELGPQTMVLCGREVMRAEGLFDSVVRRARTWEVRGDELVLEGEGMRTVLRDRPWLPFTRGAHGDELASRRVDGERQWSLVCECGPWPDSPVPEERYASWAQRPGPGVGWTSTRVLPLDGIPGLQVPATAAFSQEFDGGSFVVASAPSGAASATYEVADDATDLGVHDVGGDRVVIGGPARGPVGGTVVVRDAAGAELVRIPAPAG